tara:strand:+ start:262 stop:861 length:600 start_codon:yes stop_codon:yes gene_type:complete
MCDPVSATLVISSVASSIVQFTGAKQQAKAQAAYQAQSIAAAQRKQGFQTTAAGLEQQQKELAIAQEKGKVTKRAREQLATATVSAGEAGVSGLSVQALMDDYVRQQAGQQVALTTQQKLYGLQHGLGLKQIGLASEQEILGLSQPVPQPSALGAGLSAISNAASAYGTGLTIGNRMGSGGGGQTSAQSYTQAMTGRKR